MDYRLNRIFVLAVFAVSAAILVAFSGGSRADVADSGATQVTVDALDALTGAAISDHTFSYRVNPSATQAPELADMLSLPLSQWQAPEPGTPNFGYTRDTYWFKVTLRVADPAQAGRYYYVIDYPVLDHIDFYLVSDGVVESRYTTGDTYPYRQRPVESNKFVFPVALDSGAEKTIYVRLKTQGTMQLPARLLTEKAYYADEFSFYMLQGLFVGVIGIMLFYNMSLWYVFRTRDYMFYVLYGMSMLVVQLTMLGLTFQYLWPTATWWNNAVIPFSIVCTMACLLLFTNSFLSISRHRAGTSRVIHGYCALLAAFALASFLMPYELAIRVAIVSVIPGLLLALGAAIAALGYNAKLARLYLVSWVGVLTGSASLALTKFGLLPTNIFTTNSWQIGAGLEITLLSFALSSKIKAVTDAKITAEKKAKKATAMIARHLEQFKTIYNNSIEGLFKIDLENQKLIYNNSFAKLNGLEKGIGESQDQDLIAELIERLKLNQCSVADKNGSTRRNEEQVVHQTGNRDVWFAIKRRFLENDNGEIIAIEGSIVDISDRKLKEKAEVKLVESLKKADKIKNEFLSTISHELLTPLNGLNGHVQLLGLQLQNNEHLQGMEQSAAEMQLLINRILNFSQLQAGRLMVEPSRFSLRSMLDPLIARYRTVCQAQSLAFDVTIEEPANTLFTADAGKLYQVLDELLANAVKFTQAGKVRLSVTCTPLAVRKQEGGDDRMTVHFSVVDTGIGIREEDRDRIFALFQQVDGSFARNYGGVGLGLYLSKSLTGLLGGELTLASVEGQGSCFGLTLDMKTEASVTTLASLGKQPQLSANNESDKTVRLLVVEDNSVNQTIMKGMLKSLGYHCQIADNGQVALDMMADQAFDLVFMDCQMPVKDGFETTRLIRACPGPNQRIPIIAVTANAMSGDRERCLTAGMNDFLQKPVKRDGIRQALAQWLFSLPDTARSAG